MFCYFYVQVTCAKTVPSNTTKRLLTENTIDYYIPVEGGYGAPRGLAYFQVMSPHPISDISYGY